MKANLKKFNLQIPSKLKHDSLCILICSSRFTPRQVDTNIVIVRVDPELATPGQVVTSLAKVFFK